MARIRTIKPEFFTDEDIGELPPLHRLLFVALWMQADRRGRLADKPISLKVKCLPYDDCDIDQMLTDLAGRGFIRRYEVQGARIIEIPKFLEHQRPHPKEPDMGFPDPPDASETHKPEQCREKTRPEILNAECIPSSPVGREGKGKEGKVHDLLAGLSDQEPTATDPTDSDPTVHPEPEKPPKKLSAQQEFHAWAQEQAGKRISGRAPESVKPVELNSALREPMQRVGRTGLEAAWLAYLDDPGAAKNGWPWRWFVSQWEQHHNRALTKRGGAPPQGQPTQTRLWSNTPTPPKAGAA